MEENIFQPSLEGTQAEPTKSYNINKLFYVAFFGGLVPTMILFTKNATWLKVDRKTINLLIGVGILLLLLKVIVTSTIPNSILLIPENSRYLRWGFRIAAVLLYLVYFKIMKGNYQKHIMLGGEDEPLLKDALIFIVIGTIVEIALLAAGKAVFSNAF